MRVGNSRPGRRARKSIRPYTSVRLHLKTRIEREAVEEEQFLRWRLGFGFVFSDSKILTAIVA